MGPFGLGFLDAIGGDVGWDGVEVGFAGTSAYRCRQRESK